MEEKKTILDVKHLRVDFTTDQGTVQAVRDVSFSVKEGEILGIVGESGSGKSVTMYSVMGLLAQNGSINEGEIVFNGESIARKDFPDNRSYEKKITLATDIGHVTDTIRESIEDSDVLLLEANHDVEMLKKGGYPWSLKQRILGENGHLSNHTAGRLLAEVMTGKMKYVFLGHLSEENNNPHLAYETVEEILRNNRIEVGTHVKMDMASRFQNGVKVEL